MTRQYIGDIRTQIAQERLDDANGKMWKVFIPFGEEE